eukprot:CAMPEP_0184695396 /NCGR_PEP_ID=MMETSP0313-20130426/3032_1 /TAXON_ID=2792 /ORGANISM="Porphyridium aerugineum, Strain SAG 1380-2" /LENGTH=138 /DNA_ID=CAMNT_0027153833 /DNA_START=232 /DNA_END=648 /DNA_ORIENTATION=-
MALSRRYPMPTDLWYEIPRFESLFRPMELENSAFGAMNSYTTKDGTAVVHMDLPGVKKEDVVISHEHGMVNIKAKRQTKFEDEKVTEESYSEITRSFMIPDKVYDVEKADATLVDGVLKIAIPKLPENKQAKKSIAIQ